MTFATLLCPSLNSATRASAACRVESTSARASLSTSLTHTDKDMDTDTDTDEYTEHTQYTQANIRTHAHTHTQMHTQTHTHKCTHKHTHTNTHIHTSTFERVSANTQKGINAHARNQRSTTTHATKVKEKAINECACTHACMHKNATHLAASATEMYSPFLRPPSNTQSLHRSPPPPPIWMYLILSPGWAEQTGSGRGRRPFAIVLTGCALNILEE